MSLEQALAANTAALERLLAVLTNAENTAAISAPPAEEAPAAPKARRAKKEAAPGAPAGEPASAPTAEPAASGEPSAPEPDAASPSSPSATTQTTEPPTYADAAAAVTRVVKEMGTPRAKELLAMFGAGNLKEVKPERYAAVIVAAEVVLTGGASPF
jgi:hypothetical protein